MQLVLIRYPIDSSDRLVHVNDTWSDFARANGGEKSLPDHVLGHVLWEFVADLAIRDIYRRLVAVARKGRPSQFRYRCDSAHHKRVFEMQIAAVSGNVVEFSSSLQHDESRAPISLLDAAQPRNEMLLRICSWCHAVAWPGEPWQSLECAAERVVAAEPASIPSLTHGICEECAATMFNYVREA